MKNSVLKLKNFTLEPFNDEKTKHQTLKENIINMSDSDLISKDIDRFIKRNYELGLLDGITKTYAVNYNNEYIGLAFVNYHPKETINNKSYDEEIEIGLGILPFFRGKGLDSLLEKELSEKLLTIYPRFSYIVARTDSENKASIRSGEKAGFKHIKDDEYHFMKGNTL